jgi:hypothetical protein
MPFAASGKREQSNCAKQTLHPVSMSRQSGVIAYVAEVVAAGAVRTISMAHEHQ